MNIMRKNLIRLQHLQVKAFDAGLNMEFGTRETDTGNPWIVGHAKLESATYGDDKDSLSFYFYDWTGSYSDEERTEIYEKEMAKIEEFIARHTHLVKYGENWDMVLNCPKTDNSWLCATVDDDQIWVDEVEGKRFLLSGGEWYECYI